MSRDAGSGGGWESIENSYGTSPAKMMADGLLTIVAGNGRMEVRWSDGLDVYKAESLLLMALGHVSEVKAMQVVRGDAV